MITQALNLNLIPGQVLPRVNVSQYDSGTRTLQLSIFNGTQAFNITSGLSGFIQGTKPDRTGFQYAASVTVGSNVVTADITQQMTAVSGEVTCELVLANQNDRIATVNFIIYVEPAALADDTIISETDIPLIEEAAELAEQIETLVPEIEANAYKAEAYGAGTKDGDPVPSTDPAYHNNAKYYSDQAAASAASVGDLAEDAEAWAVGERGGVPVTSGDDTYHNNSKYYAGQASDEATAAGTSASNANTDALKAEGYAIGKQNGTAVTSGSPYYHNNAEYYSGEASSSATNASTSEYNAGLSESAAAQSEEDSEAWAVGARNGVPVTSGDPTFQNNAKYYAQQAGSTALSALSDVTISSPQNGDTLEYNSTSQKWENSAQIQTLANGLSTEITNRENTDSAIDAVISTNGAKNLCPNTATTQVVGSEVTYTVNPNGTVSATTLTTTTSGRDLVICTLSKNEGINTMRGTFKLIGVKPDTVLDSAWMAITFYNRSTDTFNSIQYVKTADGYSFDITDSVYVKNVIVTIGSGQTFSGYEFRPMITLASQPNSDYAHYVPYAKTNRTITEELTLQDISSQVTWDITGDVKSVMACKYGKMITVYGYIKPTNNVAVFSNILHGLPRSKTNVLSNDVKRDFEALYDYSTGYLVSQTAMTAGTQYFFSFTYLMAE